MLWLPLVTPSFGVSAVSPLTMVMRPGSTSSSSAAICISAVTAPWPISTLPVQTVTLPSAPICSQASSRRLVCRLPGRRLGCGGVVCCAKAGAKLKLSSRPLAKPRRVMAFIGQPSRTARCTAATMRLCVPQRHRYGANASRISGSLGSGVLSSSALAAMIMPLAQ